MSQTWKNLDLGTLPGHVVRRVHQLAVALYAEELGDINLTPVQYSTLQTVCSSPGIDQKTLASTIGFDASTIAGVIDRLEKKGWISRVVRERDRRSRELSLTEQGNSILSALQPIVQDLQKDILRPLNDADRACFIALARQVVWPD